MLTEEMASHRETEQTFRNWLSLRWGKAFPSFVEPTRGSTVGMPDLLLQLPDLPGILPVELKIGVKMTKEKTGLIRPRSLRAEQILWHDTLFKAGGKSCILLGVPQGKVGKWRGRFEVYVQPRCNHAVLRDWRKGWPIGPQFIDGLTRITNDLNQLSFEAWKACLGPQPSAAVGQPHQPSEEPAGALKRAAR